MELHFADDADREDPAVQAYLARILSDGLNIVSFQRRFEPVAVTGTLAP